MHGRSFAAGLRFLPLEGCPLEGCKTRLSSAAAGLLVMVKVLQQLAA